MLPRPDKRLEILEVLRSVQGPTQAREGCATCRIYEEEGQDRSILYLEEWESEGALREHARSELYRRVLAALELSDQPPEVSYHLVSVTRGIELLEDFRELGEEAPALPPA